MGSLKNDTTYIYERTENEIYAREVGSLDKKLIGWHYDPYKLSDDILWKDIRETAKSNATLQKVLDNAITIYKIIKEDSK